MKRGWWLDAGAALVTLALCRPALGEPGERVPSELPTGDVAALATSGGRLFVGMFDRGLVHVAANGAGANDVERSARRAAAANDGLEASVDRNVNALVVDREGTRLWIGTARGLFACAADEPRRCARVGGNRAVHAVLALRHGGVLAGGDGGLFVVPVERSAEGGRREHKDGATQTLDRKHGAPFRAVWALAEADDGTLFVGTTSGLYYGRPDAFFARERAVERSARRAAAANDVERSARRAAAASDAPATKPARAALVTGDLPDDWVTAVVVAGEHVHVGTYNAGIASFRLSRGELSQTAVDSSLGYVNPDGVEPLPDGALAVATMDGLRVGAPGAWRTVPTIGRDVTAVLPTGAGDYWVASRRGVERLDLAAPSLPRVTAVR